MDKNQCRYLDNNGQVQNPTMQPCAEGISAVKAIAIAQQQSQKIYTINENNRNTALPKLPIGGDVGFEIRNAINAGKEVTFHEARIHEHGWSGYGYSIVDPETGAGAYLIEGKGNGGWFMLFLVAALASLFLPYLVAAGVISGALGAIGGVLALITTALANDKIDDPVNLAAIKAYIATAGALAMLTLGFGLPLFVALAGLGSFGYFIWQIFSF
ncbi:hypothetical protein ABFV80_001140 [Vandammella animalimorsus]|uniref:hypothetical protein n=1 Tax=Vandammella animalimorsus TaxID=2029117 RepID=UPI00325BA39D